MWRWPFRLHAVSQNDIFSKGVIAGFVWACASLDLSTWALDNSWDCYLNLYIPIKINRKEELVNNMEPSTDWAANLKMFPEVPEEEEGVDRVGSNIY